VRHSWRVRIIGSLSALPALLLAVLLPAGAAAQAAAEIPPPSSAAVAAVDAGTVLLVVSPHPDDETLCCAGVMQRVLAAGGRVSVVWLTSGDGSQLGSLLIEKRLFADAQRMRAYGERRMGEARAATGALGLTAHEQLFLGYPDGGLLALRTGERSRAYKSRYTAVTAVPYTDALFPGHPYTEESLERDFAAVLSRVQPTLILAPSPLDTHPDHHAAGLLAIEAARNLSIVAMRFWIVHGGEGWPSPRALIQGIPMSIPPVGAPLGLRPFELSPAEEDTKLAALRAYQTQMRVMEPFLLAFVRTTELFAQAPLTAGPAPLTPDQR
jgi:LmbE family N-acetylglucosaminyl deacetylase